MNVAGFCIDTNKVKYYIKFNTPFTSYSKKLHPIMKDLNNIIDNPINHYRTIVKSAT